MVSGFSASCASDHPYAVYRYFKIAIFALLLSNAAFYTAREEASSALDEAAWLLLLALFEWEAAGTHRPRDARLRAAIPAIRLIAAGAVDRLCPGRLLAGRQQLRPMDRRHRLA